MRKAIEPKDRIIVALDMPGVEEAKQCAEELAPYVGLFKVGLEAITSGSAKPIVGAIREAGGSVFYDGKFCDIPNTVAAASREATLLGVEMFNVHCTCGEDGMRAAAEAAVTTALIDTMHRPAVLGVTILTSLNPQLLEAMGVFNDSDIRDKVVALAVSAQKSGLDGVIASPQEIGAIREACGDDFLIVTPGVRPAGADLGDQKRVMTPGEAIKAGADLLVIGRPILKPTSDTWVEAAQRIAEEIASVL